MDTKAVLARFEAERQALALMDHPHIAKVFDAGTDDTGRPYFVMEYVKGKPITEYADQNHLTIKERLELFEQVCHDRLLTKKLVTRTASKEDLRFQTVALTPAGRKLVPTLAALADANDARFFGHLGDEQRMQLMELMKDIARRHGLKIVPVE